jgi:N-glycosidase YbiA
MISGFNGRWSFLSNFYSCIIYHQGLEYKSVEAFYVAMKIDSDQIINGKYYTSGDFREMISKLDNPGLIKKIGQKVKLRKDWDSKKLEYMNWAVREKFKDETLKELLLLTGDQEIIEENYWGDTFWGVCKGKGQNYLGKILMKVRDELRGIKRTGLEEILK